MQQGIINENDFVSYYNNKRVKDLGPFQQKFIHDVFNNNIDDDSLIKADICNRYSKPDIYLLVNNITKYISIKSGRSDSMHFEPIKDLIIFLRDQGISNRTLKTILLYHYGDGTLDGTGDKRYLFEELIQMYSKNFKEANNELNNPKIINKAIDRFVFDGTEDRKCKVDYLYFGNVKYGEYISKEKLKRFVFEKAFRHILTIHFGPLTIQPYLRDVNRKSKNEFKRHIMQVKWHYLLTDIQYANKRKYITN